MKKRAVAVVLSLAMCVSGSGFVSASELTDGAAMEISTQSTEEVSQPAEEASVTEETPAAEGTAAAEPAADEFTASEDTVSVSETAEQPAAEDGTAEPAEEVSAADDFTDGSSIDATANPVSETDTEEEGIALALPESTPGTEDSNTVYFTRWESVTVDEKSYWKLQKPCQDNTSEPVYYTAEDGIVTVTTIYTESENGSNIELFKGAYLFDSNGYMVTGDQTIGSLTYHFTTYEEAALELDESKAESINALLEQLDEKLNSEYEATAAYLNAQSQTAATAGTAETVEASDSTESTETAAASEADAALTDTEAADTAVNEASADGTAENAQAIAEGEEALLNIQTKAEKLAAAGDLMSGMGALEEDGQISWNPDKSRFEYYDSETNSFISEFADKQLIYYETAVFCVKADGTLYTGAQTVTSAIALAGEDGSDDSASSTQNYLFDAVYTDASGNDITGAADTDKWVWTGTAFIHYGENGAAVAFTDKQVIEPYSKVYFCVKADGTPYNQVMNNVTVNGTKGNYYFKGTYTTDDKKTIKGKLTGKVWVWSGKAFAYYDANGKAITFKDKQVIQPYSKIYFCVNKNGVPYQSEIKTTVNGKSGYFAFKDKYTNSSKQVIPGKMVTNKWVEYTGDTYANAKNKAKYGNYYRFYNKNGVRETKKSGVYCVKNNKTKYYIYQDGYLVRGRMAKAGNNGKYYASRDNGTIYISQIVSVNNQTRKTSSENKGRSGYSRYYFKADGSLSGCHNVWAWIGSAKGYYYFGAANGLIVEYTGFQKLTINGQYKGWLYFDGNHNPIKSQWRADKQRYFGSDGIMYSGFRKVGKTYYFFQKSTASAYRGKIYKKTLIQDTKNGTKVYYYAYAYGGLQKSGWLSLEGKGLYHFTNYMADRNTPLKWDGVMGRTDDDGVWHYPGWIVVNDSQNMVMYLNPSTGQYAKSQVLTIDGKQYRFDSNGFRVNDRSSEAFSGTRYLECDRVNGVMTVYTDSSKKIPVKQIRVSVGLPSTQTPTGTYVLYSSARWQLLMGPSWGQYGTYVNGAGQGGIYVHSVSGSAPNSYSLPAGEYNKLGRPASHGCIRCCVADAKFVFYHCNGATIRIFDGTYTSSEAFKSPLGRDPLMALRGSCNFDPTDPAV